MLSRLARLFILTGTVFLAQFLAGQAMPTSPTTAITSQRTDFARQSHQSPEQIEQRVNALLAKMTLQEKVGQLVQYSAGTPTGPGTGRNDYHQMIGAGEVGALFNLVTAHDANAFQHIAVENSRLHIPLLFGLDVIHGFRTTFPVPLGLASTWDPALVQSTARVAAREASAAGIRWTFSPMVDIARDARWGRMIEGAGEDPYLGAVMAQAYVRGYQGNELDDADSIAACPKHFVGYGAAEGGRDYNSAEISEHTLRQYYLPPFKAAMDAGAPTIMAAFDSLNGVPASANPFTLNHILRTEWGFRGFVDSDWTSVSELMAHGIANDGATAARKALSAGLDMDMESNLFHEHLTALVRSGQIPEATVTEAARRILRVKMALGLFEHPYADEAQESSTMLQPDSIKSARTAAEASFVLLKNDAVAGKTPLLPLTKSAGVIALLGPLADDAINMLGSWAGQGRPEDAITLKASLLDAVGADHFRYAKGGEITDSSDSDLAQAVATAKQSDIVILALGEDAGSMTAEAASRAHLNLPGRQQQLLEQVVATGKPVILILFSGRPLTLPWAYAHVSAVLEAWFPGIQAGPALVRTLFGDTSPSGHLVVSWPRTVGQEPLYYNALNTGRPAKNVDLSRPPATGDDKYVSRYIDVPNSPQFPFGYGLTYTQFRYGAASASTPTMNANRLISQLLSRSNKPVVEVSAEITNIGSRVGTEVVQAYVGLRGTSVAQPVRALKGFQRVTLQPGETRTVTFPLSADAFALWDATNEYTIEPAQVMLWVSPTAVDGTGTVLEIR